MLKDLQAYKYLKLNNFSDFFSLGSITLLFKYRSLLEAETLKFSVMMHYPIAWNSHQSWNLNLTATKATLHVIYEHRYFFQGVQKS